MHKVRTAWPTATRVQYTHGQGPEEEPPRHQLQGRRLFDNDLDEQEGGPPDNAEDKESGKGSRILGASHR